MSNQTLNNSKTPPQAIDIEEVVIGAMLIDEKGIIEGMPLIKDPAIFYKEAHRYVFEAMAALNYRGEGVDLLTVCNELKKKGRLEMVGGEFEIINLTQKVSSSAHIEHHIRILLEKWIKRQLIKKSNEIIEMAYRDNVDVFDLLDADAKGSMHIEEVALSGSREINFPDVMDDVVKRVETISNKKDGEITGVCTGFTKIDRFTGGWQNSDLIILAARPGMGKTALVLKNLVECGLQNVSAGFISLEMSAQQLGARMVSINSNFHLSQLLRDGFDKSEYFHTLVSKVDPMKKFPVYINDTASMDIKDIISQARIWHRKYGIKILFLDYIQLAQDKSKSNNREQEIASISRNLKKIAKELQIPVVALSQLSRKVEERGGDKRPKLSDIRESGAIEQDADIITFLYRPEYYGFDLPEEYHGTDANSELIFGKYRNGSLETKLLYFDTNKAKYMDPADKKPDHFM
jgi:replicative DNA helicase